MKEKPIKRGIEDLWNEWNFQMGIGLHSFDKFMQKVRLRAKCKERERIRKKMIVWANKIPLCDRSTDSYNVAKKMIDECFGEKTQA